MDISTLHTRELDELGKRVNGGTFGADYAPMTKDQKVAFIVKRAHEKYGERAQDIVAAAALSILQARDGDAGDLGDGCEADGSTPDGSGSETPPGQPDGKVGVAQGNGKPDEGAQAGQGQPVSGMMDGVMEAIITQVIRKVADELTDDKYGTAEANAIKDQVIKTTAQGTLALDGRIGELETKVETKLKSITVTVAPVVKYQFPGVPEVDTDLKHPIYSKLYALLSLSDEYRQPIALVGPAGSGKTTIFNQAAADLRIRYGAVSCSMDMTIGKLEGRVLPLGSGRYVPSELVQMYPEPGLYVLDEYDAAPAEIIVGLNAPLSNGGFHVEPRSFADLPVYVKRHPEFRFGACLNTFGTGPTALYVGRGQQDAASMDRWLILYMDDDPALWARIAGVPYTAPVPWFPIQRSDELLKADLAIAHDFLRNVKKRAEATNIRRVVSVRAMLRARACLMAGFSMEDTKEVLLAGWKPDERAQVTG